MSDAPNALAALIRARLAEKTWTYGDVVKNAQQRGKTISRSTVFALANDYDRHHAPFERTLKALAAGLEYPYDVVAEAAAQTAGYKLQEITTTLPAAGTARVVIAAIEEMDDASRAKIEELALKYAAQTRERAKERAKGDG